MKLNEKQIHDIDLVLKILSALAAILYFIPFCSFYIYLFGLEASANVSFCTLTFGLETNGYSILDGSFIFIFILLLPLAVICLLQFSKKESIKYGVSFLCAIVAFVVMLIAAAIPSGSGSYLFGLIGGEFRTLAWATIDCIIVGIISLACGILYLTQK